MTRWANIQHPKFTDILFSKAVMSTWVQSFKCCFLKMWSLIFDGNQIQPSFRCRTLSHHLLPSSSQDPKYQSFFQFKFKYFSTSKMDSGHSSITTNQIVSQSKPSLWWYIWKNLYSDLSWFGTMTNLSKSWFLVSFYSLSGRCLSENWGTKGREDRRDCD